MKRIKQEQHIEIEEKSQQLKFRMQTEIQINKHHALCQASDQLEELDYLHTGRSAELPVFVSIGTERGDLGPSGDIQP